MRHRIDSHRSAGHGRIAGTGCNELEGDYVTPGASSRRPLPASKRAGVAADRAAAAMARRLGRSVTVTSQTTATSMTVAHPNGTLTTTMYALPVRTKVGGRWVPVQVRLTRTRTGWSPAAVPSSLTFSPGGVRPLVTMTSPHGSLALTFPGRLPAPAIRGGTATYRNALPGVSLALTASTLGGVAITFSVANARAATSPALRHLHLTVTTRGLIAGTDLGVASTMQTAANDNSADWSFGFRATRPRIPLAVRRATAKRRTADTAVGATTRVSSPPSASCRRLRVP